MTDNEIVKAQTLIKKLEEAYNAYYDTSKGMPYDIDTTLRETAICLENSLAEINRQKAEIEKLRKRVNFVEQANVQLREELKETTEKFNCQQYVYDDLSKIIKEQAEELKTSKAEIEDLKKEINHYKINLPYLEHQNEDFCGVPCSFMKNLVEKAKAEAIKEFAERLKEEEFASGVFGSSYCRKKIDNLIKEMVGEG